MKIQETNTETYMTMTAELIFQACGMPKQYGLIPFGQDELNTINSVKMGWDICEEGSNRLTGTSILIMQDGTSYVGNGMNTKAFPTMSEALIAFTFSDTGIELGWSKK